jgi:phosphoribosyl 1,2-cyclic phosphate phosphodiesterase
MEWRDAATATSRVVIIDPGMDLRQQAMRSGITRLDGALITHIHVDHTGGIDELRAYTDAQEEVLDVGAGPETCTELMRRWEYAFDGRTAPGHGIPSLRLMEAVPHVQLGGRAFEAIPLIHGRRPAHGWRSGAVAYLTDVSAVSPASRERLLGLDTLIVSALRDLPHPTHQTVEEALALIVALGPRLAILTHLDHDLDYQELSARLPNGVLAGFDGLVVEVAAR